MPKITQKGAILIITFLILGIILLLGSYFLTFVLTEFRISKSQQASARSYYLAEAGINEAIWKLKNDPVWQDGFVSGDSWSANFSRSFDDGSSYAVTIQNSEQAKAEIISASTAPLSAGKTAKRVVKATVFKALASPVRDSAVLSGGASENIDIQFSRLKINDGNIFSNHHLNIKWLSDVRIYDDPETDDLEGKALVAGNFIKSDDSSIISEATCAANVCTEECEECPPSSFSTPLVDFDSSSPFSFKSRAQFAELLGQCHVLCNGAPCVSQPSKCVYSASELEDLLWEAKGLNRYEYYNAGNSIIAGTFGQNWEGQIFTAATTHSIDMVKLQLGTAGKASGNILADIQGVSAGGYPNGVSLCSGSMSASLVSKGSVKWYQINLAGSNCNLNAGVKYAIVVSAQSTAVFWSLDQEGDYSSGDSAWSSDGGLSWNIRTDQDFLFEVWGISSGGELTLNNEITYITGSVDLKAGRHLIINGALVADDNIYIGDNYSWVRNGRQDAGFSQLTINRPSEWGPSGILTKRKISFGSYSSFQPINITGIIYANDQASITNVPQSFDVVGGIIARKVYLSSVWQWLNITLDNDIIWYGLGYKIDGFIINPSYSPIITIDHWEELY